MPRKKAASFDFEKSLAQLNELVEKMEQGNLSLEGSLKSFEEGVSMIRECQKALAEAEQKIQILTKDNDQDTLQPYHTNNPDDD